MDSRAGLDFRGVGDRILSVTDELSMQEELCNYLSQQYGFSVIIKAAHAHF